MDAQPNNNSHAHTHVNAQTLPRGVYTRHYVATLHHVSSRYIKTFFFTLKIKKSLNEFRKILENP